MGAMAEPVVRPARRDDASDVATALYESSPAAYDVYAGGRERALRLLAVAFARRSNSASRDAVTVAELDGRVVAAMAAFPAAEAPRRAYRFLALTLLRLPPWRWAHTILLFRAAARQTPDPPPDSLYVDGLATLPEARRRGAARGLLAEAERRARAGGFSHLALDTTASNERALALYRAAGFEVTGERPALGEVPAIVGLAKRLA